MGKPRISAIIALDGEKEFKQSVTNVNKELSNLKAESKLVSAQFEGQANTLEALKTKHETLTKVLDAQNKKEKEIIKGLNHAHQAYENVDEGLDDLRKRLSEAKTKMEQMEKSTGTSTKELEKQKKEVKDLGTAVEKGEKNLQNAANRIQDWETKLKSAQAQTLQANKALKINEAYLREAENATDKCAKSIDSFGKKTEKAGDATISWNEAIKTAIASKGMDIIADGAKKLVNTSTEAAIGMDSASKQVQASTGITEQSAKRYQKIMEELYKENYGDDFNDISDTVSKITQQMGELNNTDLKDITESVITLRDTWDMDTNESIRGAQALIEHMGGTAEEAFDLIAKGAQNGLNKSGELTDNLAEYTQLFSQAGFSSKQMFTILQNGVDAGAYNLDKVNDVTKEILISMSDGRLEESISQFSDKTGMLFQKWKEGSATQSEVFYSIIDDLNNMTSQQEALTLASDTWSALGEDNSLQVLMSLNDVSDKYKDVEGTMRSVQDIKYDDLSSQITEVGRTFQMKLAEPIANKMLPKINKGLEFAGEHLAGVSAAAAGLGMTIGAYRILKSNFFGDIVKSMKTLTTATQTATAAQEGLNVAQSMSPMGWLSLAIAGVTAAFTAYQIFSEKATDQTKEFIDQTDAALDNMEANADEIRESLSDTEAEWEANDKLLGKLLELNEVQEKTAGQKQEMSALVSQLSDAVPGLADAFDEETGSLNLTKEAVEQLYGSQREYAMYLAHEDSLKEWAKQAADAESELKDVNARIEELKGQQEELMNQAASGKKDANWVAWDSGKISKQIKDLEKQQGELNDQIEEANQKMGEAEEAINDYGEGAQKAAEKTEEFGDAQKKTADTVSGMTAVQREAFEELRKSVESSIDSCISVFDEFSGGTKISAEDINKNLKSQIEGVSNWKENMVTLSQAAGQGMTQEFYDYLAEMGPESANLVQTLVNSLKEEDGNFQKICKNWTKAMDLSGGISTEVANAGNAFVTAVDPIKATATTQGEALGANLAIGTAAGIRDYIPYVETEAEHLINAANEAAKKKAEIHSPSKLFEREVGKQIPTGTAFGIKRNASVAGKEASKMSQLVYTRASEWLKKYKKNHKTTAEDEKYFWKQIVSHTKQGTSAYNKAVAKMDAATAKIIKADVSLYTTTGTGKNKKTKKKDAQTYYSEIYSAAEDYLKKQEILHDWSLNRELSYWKSIRSQLKKGTDAWYDATKQIKGLQQDISEQKKEAAEAKAKAAAEKLEARANVQKDILSTYKVYHKVSAKAEMDYWNTARKQFKSGTKERVEADEAYLEAKENYYDQLNELNEEYAEKQKEVNDELAENTKELQEAYKDAVKSREQDILSSMNLFEAWDAEGYKPDKLLYNLKTQVKGLELWESQLEELGRKNISAGLLDELKQMGPDAAANIYSLNQMTAEQLDEYNKLWEEKNKLAHKQAVKDNESLLRETNEQLAELKRKASEELKAINSEYQKEISALNTDLDSGLKNMVSQAGKIGEDIVTALVSGIKTSSSRADVSKAISSLTQQASGKDDQTKKTDKILTSIKKGKKRSTKITSKEKKEHHALWEYIVSKYGYTPTNAIYKEIAGSLGVKTSSTVTSKQKDEILKALKKKGYASGTRNIWEDGLKWLYENGGTEYVVRKSDGAILQNMLQGDKVINPRGAENIYDFAMNPNQFLQDRLQSAIDAAHMATQRKNELQSQASLFDFSGLHRLNRITEEQPRQTVINMDTSVLASMVGTLIEKVETLGEKMENMDMVLDTGELVGGIQEKMSRENAAVVMRRNRGRLR